MKTLLITTALLISATSASAFTCKNTVTADAHGVITYTASQCGNQAPASADTLAMITYIANNPPKDNVEEVVSVIIDDVVVLDGKYVTKTKFWGDPNTPKQAGKVRKEITKVIYDNGVLIAHRTITKTKRNGDVRRSVDNHLTQTAFKVTLGGDKKPQDYQAIGTRTVAGTGDWVTTKPTVTK